MIGLTPLDRDDDMLDEFIVLDAAMVASVANETCSRCQAGYLLEFNSDGISGFRCEWCDAIYIQQ